MRARWLFPPVLVALALSAPLVLEAPVPAGAVSTCAARAFVANNGDGSVSVLDLATDTVVGAPLTIGGGPAAVATSPDGQRVYVTNDSGTTMTVLDAVTGGVLATVEVGASPVD